MEFKDNDNVRKDPTPELALYLPDITVGGINGEKFNIKGKDQSGGVGAKLSGSSEIAFKAHTASDAEQWYQIIREMAGNKPIDSVMGSEASSPTSPTMRQVSGSSMDAAAVSGSRNVSGSTAPPLYTGIEGQSAGVTGEPVFASPVVVGGVGKETSV